MPDGPRPTAASVPGGTFVVAWTTSRGAGAVAVAFDPLFKRATMRTTTTTTTTSPPDAHGHQVRPRLGGGRRAGAGRVCLTRLGGGRLGPPRPPREDVRPELATSSPN